MKLKISIGTWTAITMILLGLLVVILTLFLKTNYSKIHPLIFSFFELLGFTLFTSGIFTILLQLPDWRKYFEDRLKVIILEQDYLNSLDSASLSELQVKTLKAFFKTSDIDKEGSFLKYFQDNLNQYMEQPYREEVKTEINVLKVEKDGYIISDRIMYKCRAVNGKIQASVKWQPDKDEFIEIKSVEINLISKDQKKNVLELAQDESGNYKLKDQSLTLSDINEKGISYSLSNHQEDKLVVEVKSVYKISKESFCNWSMAHPTKGFYITIKFPENCKIRFQPLLLHPEKIIIGESKGLFTMEYDEWLLPKSGVVYSFIEIKETLN